MKFTDWDNPEAVQAILNKSHSQVEALELMGYKRTDGYRKKKLVESIRTFNLSTKHFRKQTDTRWEDLPEIVPQVRTYSELLRLVGLSDKGNNRLTAKRYVAAMGLNTDHFLPTGSAGGSAIRTRKWSGDDILCVNSKVARTTVREHVKRNNLLEYRCHAEGCVVGGVWNGHEIVLQLDHINGKPTDNRIENLRYLCPNCHTQTGTWGTKVRGVGQSG